MCSDCVMSSVEIWDMIFDPEMLKGKVNTSENSSITVPVSLKIIAWEGTMNIQTFKWQGGQD